MTNSNDVRNAHHILDKLDARAELSQAQEKLLRSFLPELPKQKTLEEIYKYVDDAWLEADDPESKEWLHELHAQLKGLIDTPVTVPALPEGIRLADHEQYGRCVVSPATNGNGECLIFVLTRVNESGASWGYVEYGSLTFIDVEPAKPAHPEFLETEADYQNAPDTQVIRTPEELEVLDPDTVFMNTWGDLFDANNVHAGINTDDFPYYFPCSVVASGDQVRAAREAMEQEHE